MTCSSNMSFCFERSWMIFVLSMLFFCSARSEQGVPVVISCTDYVLGSFLTFFVVGC